MQETAPASADEEGFSLSAFEENLNQKLAAIEGVGRVGLMLSLDQTEEAVYAVNTRRTDSEAGGQSYESDLTVVSDGSYGAGDSQKPAADLSRRGRAVRWSGQCGGAAGCNAGGDHGVRHRGGQSYGSENGGGDINLN